MLVPVACRCFWLFIAIASTTLVFFRLASLRRLRLADTFHSPAKPDRVRPSRNLRENRGDDRSGLKISIPSRRGTILAVIGGSPRERRSESAFRTERETDAIPRDTHRQLPAAAPRVRSYAQRLRLRSTAPAPPPPQSRRYRSLRRWQGSLCNTDRPASGDCAISDTRRDRDYDNRR